MTRRLLLGYLSITTFAVVVLGVPLGVLFARGERSALVAKVRDDTSRIATFAVLPLSGQRDLAIVRQVAADYAKATTGRVTVVDGKGVAVADSDGATGSSFASRPEVASALAGREAVGFRYSQTLGHGLLYVAEPVNSGAVVLGAVRITYPAAVVEHRIRRSWTIIAAVSVAVLAAVTGLSVLFARSVTAPVRALRDAASRLGDGDLGARAASEAGPDEIRALSASFNDTADKLEQLVQAQRAFVADASHQLRTPLAAMRLRLENLAAKTSDPSQRRDATAALGEAQRLGRLVDGLLVLARADSTPTARRHLDVDAIVEERRAVWQPLANERGVDLRVQGAAGIAAITPDSLEQELDNLIANALDVSPPDTDVAITLERDAHWVRVAVTDQGPGMPAADRATAFTRFLSNGKRDGGFGLGLAIAKRLATRDGGDLVLKEAPGGGLRAELVLPTPVGASKP